MHSPSRYQLTKPVFLIGFMGAGKTTLARRLARMCGLASVDIDRCMERESGRTIKQLYTELGEGSFRELEALTLERFAQGDPLIISCGGGVVVGQRSRACIAQNGLCVHLSVSPDESMERISDHSTRPFFESTETVRATSDDRLPLYQSLADVTVDTAGKSAYDVAREVRRVLLKEGVLCPLPA